MTSANVPFDPNAYAHRQQDHHQRMLKHYQMAIKREPDISISTSFSDASTPIDGHTPSRPDTSTSGDSFSLPSPPPVSANMADPFSNPQKAQQAVSPFTYPDESAYGNLIDPAPVNPTWLSQPYYGDVHHANSSQGLGLGKSSSA